MQYGGGSFMKWDTEGQTLTGVYQGKVPGTSTINPDKPVENAQILDVETGRVTLVGISAGLFSAFGAPGASSLVPIGKAIDIVYEGQKVNAKTKRNFKAFIVRDTENADVQAKAQEVPF